LKACFRAPGAARAKELRAADETREDGEEEGLFVDTATASAGRPQDLCDGSRFRSGIARKQEFVEQEFVGVVSSSTAIARVVVEEDLCSEVLCDKKVVSSSATVLRENPPSSSPAINK
jgi:hypothetical protein